MRRMGGKLADIARWLALAAFAIAVLLLIAASIVDGSAGGLLFLVVGWVILRMLVTRIVDPIDVRWLQPVVTGAFALRCIVAAIVHLRSVALGGQGYVTGDDQMYASAAWHLVRYLSGDPEVPFVPPYWGGEYYLIGTFVYLESAIFMFFGPNVLPVIMVNGLLSALTVLLAADMACRIFGSRAGIAAACVLAVYPSLILWAAINLRDTIIVFLIVLTLWALHRYPGRWAVAWIAVMFAGMWLQQGLRRFVMDELAIAVPIGIAVHPVWISVPRRILWSGAGIAFAAALLLPGDIPSLVSPMDLLAQVQSVRSTMGIGRTAFVETPAPAVTSTTAPTTEPTTVPTTVPTTAPTEVPTTVPTSAPTVGPGGRSTTVPTTAPTTLPTLAPTSAPTTAPTTKPTTAPTLVPNPVAVVPTTAPTTRPTVLPTTRPTTRPTTAPTIGVGGSPTTVPTTVPTTAPTTVPTRAPTTVPTTAPATEAASPDAIAVELSLAHLPVGIFYALFAPFPWAIGSVADLAALPEMLLWYVVLGCAFATIWRKRRQWRWYVGEILFLAMTLFILALAEGNVGTLFRHRSMAIPIVVVIASPGVEEIGRWLLRHVPLIRSRLPVR